MLFSVVSRIVNVFSIMAEIENSGTVGLFYSCVQRRLCSYYRSFR